MEAFENEFIKIDMRESEKAKAFIESEKQRIKEREAQRPEKINSILAPRKGNRLPLEVPITADIVRRPPLVFNSPSWTEPVKSEKSTKEISIYAEKPKRKVVGF